MNPRFPFLAGLALTLGLAGCAGTPLRDVPPQTGARPGFAPWVDRNQLSAETEQFLGSSGMVRDYRRQPTDAIRSRHATIGSREAPVERLALAELCTDAAQDSERRHKLSAALGLHLAAIEVLDPVVTPWRETPAREAWNFAVSEAARLAFALGFTGQDPVAVRGPWRDYTLGWQLQGKGVESPAVFDELYAASRLALPPAAESQRKSVHGYGGALVGYRAWRENDPNQDPFVSPAGRALPLAVTADTHAGRVQLTLHDVLIRDFLRVDGREVLLSADFTAPLVVVMSHVPMKAVGFRGMLRPGRFLEVSGLYSPEPLRADKIPLVFVHGLGSDPTAWKEAVNMVLGDRTLRNRYQVMLFIYPTGLPIIYDAHLLRERLEQVSREWKSPANLRRMVLVGHSMGGLLSSFQIRDSGDRMRALFLERPIETYTELPEKARQTLESIMKFEQNDNVSRVVFMAAPHRGSGIASRPIGRLGSSLVSIPKRLVLMVDRKARIDGLTPLGEQAMKRPPDSILQLQPRNPVLMTVLDLPVSERVKLHSIIGDATPDRPLEESSDLVVPFWSSFLPGVLSQKIVHANHVEVNRDPDALSELRRILYEHLGQEP